MKESFRSCVPDVLKRIVDIAVIYLTPVRIFNPEKEDYFSLFIPAHQRLWIKVYGLTVFTALFFLR